MAPTKERGPLLFGYLVQRLKEVLRDAKEIPANVQVPPNDVVLLILEELVEQGKNPRPEKAQEFAGLWSNAHYIPEDD